MIATGKINKKIVAPLAVIVIGVGGYFGYQQIFGQPVSQKVVTAGTPVESNQNQAESSQPAVKKLTSNNNPRNNNGGAVDTDGKNKANTDSSKWVTSASGLITVKQPVADSKLSDGDTISGSAKVSQISYRLSDNQVGVIAQGTLNVVNGNFSGILHFSPAGNGGRLDIFSTDSQGVEYNEVQINVSF